MSDKHTRDRSDDSIQHWMKRSIEIVRESHPDIPLMFSEIPKEEASYDMEQYMDFFDPHIWMAGGEFYEKINYNYEKFDPVGYDNIALYAEDTYKANEAYWKKMLSSRIAAAVRQSKQSKKLLVTTEAWALVQYKDWPLLDWEWIKELCELGTVEAAKSGCWIAICTSNFCGPQFRGMWEDIEWHKRMTDIIRNAPINHYEEK